MLQQEALKKRELLTNNGSLKEQNIQLEKENIQNLEMLKQHKQKVKIFLCLFTNNINDF